MHPAFYGCFDWHSAVENHWQLVRIARLYPEMPVVRRIARVLETNITAAKIVREAAYFAGAGRGGFERPYGLAWVLQLSAELRAWDSAFARILLNALRPLEVAAVFAFRAWLPKLSHPIRSGVHAQTAFALGLALDFARGANDAAFASLLAETARRFYGRDRLCPIGYEPSGHDFLSPCLGEADLMRRVMTPRRFAVWLTRFLPAGVTMRPVAVSDPRDGHLAHFAGLNFSRAWMLRGIASGLPAGDARVKRLRASAAEHRRAALRSLDWRGYETTHWLGAYAVYLETGRGLHIS